MTKRNQNAKRSNGNGAVGTAGAVAPKAAKPETSEETVEHATDYNPPRLVDLLPGLGNRASLLAQDDVRETERLALKMRLVGDAKQKLAHAADLYKQGGETNAEAEAIANDAAVKLYQASAVGGVPLGEISAILVDVFTAKPKKDGTPGKTPAGAGETIRKRVNLMAAAHTFLSGGDGGRFFDGMKPDDEDDEGNTIQNVMDRLNNGKMSIWTAYGILGRIRAAKRVKLEAAFDVKRITAISDALAGSAAVEAFRSNPALRAAYGALLKLVLAVDAEAAKPSDETDDEERTDDDMRAAIAAQARADANPQPARAAA